MRHFLLLSTNCGLVQIAAIIIATILFGRSTLIYFFSLNFCYHIWRIIPLNMGCNPIHVYLGESPIYPYVHMHSWTTYSSCKIIPPRLMGLEEFQRGP